MIVSAPGEHPEFVKSLIVKHNKFLRINILTWFMKFRL